MFIALILALAAVALGVARGGSLDSLGATQLRWIWLLFAGLALQIALALWSPAWLTGARALLVILVSNLVILVFIAVNRRLPGMLVADVGVALNLLVIVLNGAMPVSLEAARAAGAEGAPGSTAVEHEIMDSDTSLPWLGDVIPLPGFEEVLSVGDLLLAGGIARLVYVRTAGNEAGAPTATRASG
jgi:hypothetical protein